MIRTTLALSALLVAAPATAGTLFTHFNGVAVDGTGKLQHFDTMIVGDDGKVERTYGGTADVAYKGTVIDLGGRTLLPGLVDAHGHVLALGYAALQLDLVGTASLADLQQRLKSYAASHPETRWIVGRGWNQELWPEKRFPTAADLDLVVGDRPVVLERVDGHAIVANSAAMKAAGVTEQTAAPPGGRIENGLFVDNAMRLVERAIPAATAAEDDRALARAQEILLGYGVTAVGSMSTSLGDWRAMRRAGEQGTLNVRLMAYINGAEAAEAKIRPTGWLYGDRLRLAGVKLFADGALGSRGAWLKQPYADKPDTRGLRFNSDAQMLRLADRAAAAGLQVATHAIGDAADAQVISVYEKLAKKYPGDRRWRIEHFQIADPADIPRLARAGIIASMQPTHQTSDRLMAEARLGHGRLAGAYAWRSVLKSKARLAFGTDFPVESPNPFPGLAAAVSRQDMNGEPPGGWIPAERLTLGEALRAYTREAAYAGFADGKIGALEPGKWADFIIIDRDPTRIDPVSIGKTQVLETWVAGKRVFSASPSPPAQ